MNKIIIAFGLTLAASTGASAQSSALDVYVSPAANPVAAVLDLNGVSNEQVSYDRAGNDGSPTFQAPKGGIDYTATASIGGVSSDQVIYRRAGNDGSPSFSN